MRSSTIAKICSAILSIALIVAGFNFAANAAQPETYYTALGDSISYGYNIVPGSGYADLFYNYLMSTPLYGGMKLLNVSQPGEDSASLLAKLKNDVNVINNVKKSNVITICIGANNLLGPVISALSKAFNIDSTNNPDYAAELSKAFAQNPARDAIIAEILKPQNLPLSMTSGILQFSSDFPQIIAAVKTLAPNAEIYVANIYNPLMQDDPMYKIFDMAVQKLNSIINTKNSYYVVADVYTVFKNYTDAKPLTGFSLKNALFDPHPSLEGHRLIYRAHFIAREKWVKQVSMIMKRGDFVTSLIKELGLNAPQGADFDDVKQGSGYYQPLGIARVFGIIFGTGDNKFNPEADLTRQDAMVILVRTLALSGKLPVKGSASDLSRFEDVKDVSEYAAESIAALYKNGMVSFTGGSINPQKKFTYGEYMSIIGNIKK